MNMNSMKLLGKAPFPIEAEDYLQVNQSLRKLVNLGVTLFYPSHGEVITQEKVVETIKWTGFIVHKYANLKINYLIMQ